MVGRAGWYIASRFASGIGQLALIPFAVSQLGAAGYGVFGLMLQGALLFRLLSVEHINQVVIREFHVHERNASISHLYSASWLVALSAGGLLALFLSFTAGTIADVLGIRTHHVWLSFAMGVTTTFFSFKTVFVLMQRQLEKLAVFELSSALLPLFAAILAGYFFPRPETYAIAYALIMGFLAAAFYRGRISTIASLRSLWNQFVWYGCPLMIAYLFHWGIAVIDRFQIASLVGHVETGVYAAAYQLFVAPMTIITTAIVALLQPSTFSADSNSYKVRIEQVASLLTMAFGILIVVCLFIGKDIFSIFFRHKASASIELILVLLLVGLASGYSQLEILAGKYERAALGIVMAQATALALLVLGNWILLPLFGILAAAATSLGAYVVQIGILRWLKNDNQRFTYFSCTAVKAALQVVTEAIDSRLRRRNA